MSNGLISLIKDLYPTEDTIPLHRPKFLGNEKKYLEEAIHSSYVSSIGPFVNEFESKLENFIGIKNVILTINGTSALHIALQLAGVKRNTEVITQSLTFVATCNAIHYCNAHPIFIDVDKKTLGLSAEALEKFLREHCILKDDGKCWNKSTNRQVVCCLPMHSFGFAVEIDKIKNICKNYNLKLVEDAAESMGSYYKGLHLGSYGDFGVLSFNGNKIITSGSGGAIITNDDKLASRARHVTTTARINHKWNIEHDEIGYNYRLANINAAIGLAQLENIEYFIENKREVARRYQEYSKKNNIEIVIENQDSLANYWLNILITKDKEERDSILKDTHDNKIITRPAWTPMHMLPMNKSSQFSALDNTEFLFNRIVSLPSSATDD
tara:strand:+ start:124 stop:1269 length:1146 start_codon:yes stop_codon:yes gene_type:complete